MPPGDMPRKLELRVVLSTTDGREGALDRLEDVVRSVLQTALGAQVYVEQVGGDDA